MSGTATPRAHDRDLLTSRAGSENAALRKLIGTMKDTLNTLGQSFETLGEQSTRVRDLGPTPEGAAQQMHALKKQIRAQEKKQDARMAEVKHMVRDLLKDQIYEHLKSCSPPLILYVSADLKVESQIKEHIPVPLEEQARESKRQLG